MASSANPPGFVKFEVSFQENHSAGRKEGVAPFKIHFKSYTTDIEVRVDSAFWDGQEHFLAFHTRKQGAPPKTSWIKSDWISVPLRMVSSLSITKEVISWVDGVPELDEAATQKPKMVNKVVPIRGITVEVGKTYRIQLVSEATGFVASIAEVVSDTV